MKESKKIFGIFMLGLMVLSMLPLAIAEDTDNSTVVVEDESEDESEEEVTDTEIGEELVIMHDINGAEQRLTNLELSLQRQIEHAKDILSELNISDEAMEKLEGKVIELELLLERVQAIEPTGTASDMAAEFVAIKKEVISLSFEIRKAIHSELGEEKILEIKERTREMNELRKNEFKAQLNEKKEMMYMKMMSKYLGKFGDENEDIMQQFENGELTKEQAREAIQERIKENKEEIKTKIQENREEARANIEAKKAEIRAKIEAKRAEIKANMEEKKAGLRAKFSEMIQERKANMEVKKTELQAKLAERKDGIEAKIVGQREGVAVNKAKTAGSNNNGEK